MPAFKFSRTNVGTYKLFIFYILSFYFWYICNRTAYGKQQHNSDVTASQFAAMQASCEGGNTWAPVSLVRGVPAANQLSLLLQSITCLYILHFYPFLSDWKHTKYIGRRTVLFIGLFREKLNMDLFLLNGTDTQQVYVTLPFCILSTLQWSSYSFFGGAGGSVLSSYSDLHAVK